MPTTSPAATLSASLAMPAVALPSELAALDSALEAAARDARALVSDLGPAQGSWRAASGSWSVAECLDHIAVGHRVYLDAMAPAAERARAAGRTRRRPALPGLFGGWFVRQLEPPVRPRLRMKAPRTIVPRVGPSLDDAASQFFAQHDAVRAFLARHADLDLARIHFPNPFIPGIRFSLATGLHVLDAHARRHLVQAWRTRQAAERTAIASGASIR
jgi:hypothetical protein